MPQTSALPLPKNETKWWRSVLDSNQRAAQCGHGLASRCLGPTRPTLHVCVAAEQPPLVWYPRRDSNPQNPVSETGTYAGSVTGARNQRTLHFGCVRARAPRRVRWSAARGAGRAAAHMAVAALTGGCDNGVHRHSRSGANHRARHLKIRRGALAAVAVFVARPAASRKCAGPALRQFVKQRLAAPWRGPRGAITACVERGKTEARKQNGPETFRYPGRLGHLVQVPGVKGMRLGTALPRKDGFLARIKL